MALIIDLITFGLGCYSVLVALSTFVKFMRIDLKLGRAIAWMVFGEFIMASATTTFAYMQLTGCLLSIPEEYQSLIRMIMFASAAFTTRHLSKTHDNIASGSDD